MGVLSRQQLQALLEGAEPLLTDYTDAAGQLQPNGFDMSLASIASFVAGGRLGVANSQRSIPDTEPVAFDQEGYAHLAPGTYLVTLAEAVHLPPDVMAFGKPRSSLLRSGVAIHNAVWDAGYSGRSQALLVVYNPHGFRIALGARIIQLVFLRLETPTDAPYAGRYQRERLPQ